MHVKLVVHAFPVTSETFLFNLVIGLEHRGVEVSVATLSSRSHGDMYRDRMHQWSGNLELIPLKAGLVRRAHSTWSAVAAHPAAARHAFAQHGIRGGSNALVRSHFLTSGAPDIIHFAYSGTAIAYMDAIALLPRPGPKIFVSCRGSAEKVRPITVESRGEQLRRMFQRVDRVHCVSDDMATGLREFGLRADQCFVNYPSIDAVAFVRDKPYGASARTTYSIVSTGRLHFQKGYVFALLALRELKRRGVRFRYHILGDGPDRDMLTYVIHQLGLQDDVALRGRVGLTEVRQVLGDADLFVLASLYEGIANAALEAMAMEVPVVTTTAGGMAEVIRHRENGMIVNRFDAIALADAMEELLRDDELRRSIGARGRQTVSEKFVLAHQIDTFVTEYRRALG